jgi:hypothetical protein
MAGWLPPEARSSNGPAETASVEIRYRSALAAYVMSKMSMKNPN